MKRPSSIKGWLLRLSSLLAIFLATALRPALADGVVRGYIIVRPAPGIDPIALAREYGSSLRDQLPRTGIYAFRLPNGETEETFSARLGLDARVTYAEPDTFLEKTEFHGSPFHFPFDFAGNPALFLNQRAWTMVNLNNSQTITRGAGVTVAVLDTGVTYPHPDLRPRLMPGYNAVRPGSAPADLPDGFTNAAVGHGTMIAGIVARLAPNARILPVRVLNADGVGTGFNISRGILYALNNGAKVLNMSFGSAQNSSALGDILNLAEQRGALIVAPAGNANRQQTQYPAAGRGALAVASVEPDLRKSPYSNYGSFVRVVAPGSGVYSTYINGSYAAWSGTSFATPMVAAQAALLFSLRPGVTADQVKDAIRSTARSVDAFNPNYKGKLGKGLIDIEAAILALR